jgi:DNA-binding MarR family transcriptional regulator
MVLMSDAVFTLIREVSRNFQERLQEMGAIEELKLAPFQARVLSVIHRHPAISQLTLAASTDRDKAQVARAVKELERLGLITRSAHKADWRARSLDLTDAGRRASMRLAQGRAELVKAALSACSAQEQEALQRSLEKINRSLGLSPPRNDT